jgi:pyruvate dehydrogenase E1 component alpha subunit
VAAAARSAVEHARAGRGPVFLELLTYRFRAHSMYDPDRYRDKAEIAEWRKRDPIDLYVNRLREDGGLTDEDLAAMEVAVAAEIDAAVAAAEEGPLEPVEELTQFVYSEPRSAS